MTPRPGSFARPAPRLARWIACAIAVAMLPPLAAAETSERPAQIAPAGAVQTGTPMRVAGSAVINVGDLAKWERLALLRREIPPVRPLITSLLNEAEEETDSGGGAPTTLEPLNPLPLQTPLIASPAPTLSFMGLDDIPMADSSYIVIPPDVNGAVGPARIFQNLNNNVRILDKSNGAVISTVGVNTFWAPTGASANNYTDPRTVYDPYNNRWITIMQGDLDNATGNSLVIGLSDTSDPGGSWHLYRTVLYLNSTSARYDFPTLGFNKNWITVSINRYNTAGILQGNTVVTIHYPSLLANTFTAFRFNRSDFCSAPSQTYSATCDTEYVAVHLASSTGTYRLDFIRGTGPAAPTYTAGATQTRTGGGWTQTGGQTLPQSAPNLGTSSCGATPCPIELQDSQIRTPPVYRGGSIWYAQTIGLPAGTYTHTAVQWTKITTPTGAFVDGGRVEDPTATATNGGKWYAYPQIAVNANGDFVVGYSQFSSAQHPSAGYSVHLAGDAAGTIRDPEISRLGEDYYHKDFGSGRNRWGDFSSAQVDPSDDMTLWSTAEYAKVRVNTNDGTTGSNGSRWSTWWAAVAPPTVSIDAGPSQSEGNSGTTAFNFTVRLSSAYGLPVQVNFQTTDGTATVADNDYQALTSSVTIPAGSTTVPLSVNVVGDTRCEPDETFGVTLTSTSNNIPIGVPSASTATILNDDTATITASADPGGTISPAGAVSVACGGSQTFTIVPDSCQAILDVQVDGGSVGAVSSYTFTGVQGPRTIHASFVSSGLALSDTHTEASCAGTSDGSIDLTVSGGVSPFTYAWSNGATVEDIAGLAAGSYSVTVTDSKHCVANRTVAIPVHPDTILATAGSHGSIAASGTVVVSCGSDTSFTITPDSGYEIDQLLVDGSPVAPVLVYTFTNVTANRTIAVTFKVQTVSVTPMPLEFSLGRISPNPSFDQIRFRYGLATAASCRLSILDLQGREVAILERGSLPAGWYSTGWNGQMERGRAPAGIYFVRLQAGARIFTRRFALAH
jgi:hypothetical protein